MADTKITRLRNLLTSMKNYIAMVNADKRGDSISTLLLDRELENINKHSDEIWAIIAEIPNEACGGECSNENSGLNIPVVIKSCDTCKNLSTCRFWAEAPENGKTCKFYIEHVL